MSNTDTTFRDRQRKQASIALWRRSEELSQLIYGLREDCEIIDADRENFDKYEEGEVYRNVHRQLLVICDQMDALGARLIWIGGADAD